MPSVLAAGQVADGRQFIPVPDKVRVRGPVGRPRTRPDAVVGDKAYSSRGDRAHLCRRGIKTVVAGIATRYDKPREATPPGFTCVPL